MNRKTNISDDTRYMLDIMFKLLEREMLQHNLYTLTRNGNIASIFRLYGNGKLNVYTENVTAYSGFISCYSYFKVYYSLNSHDGEHFGFLDCVGIGERDKSLRLTITESTVFYDNTINLAYTTINDLKLMRDMVEDTINPKWNESFETVTIPYFLAMLSLIGKYKLPISLHEKIDTSIKKIHHGWDDITPYENGIFSREVVEKMERKWRVDLWV